MSRFQCFILKKGEKGPSQSGKYQLLKMARSYYIVILLKS